MVTGYMDEVCAGAPEVVPVSRGLFAGKLDPASLPAILRLFLRLARILMAIGATGARRYLTSDAGK